MVKTDKRNSGKWFDSKVDKDHLKRKKIYELTIFKTLLSLTSQKHAS